MSKDVLAAYKKNPAFNQEPISDTAIADYINKYQQTSSPVYRDKLVRGMWRLIVSCAIKYAQDEFDSRLEDMVQESTIGFIKAIESYDQKTARDIASSYEVCRGVGKFISLAKRCCDNAIIDYLRKNMLLVRVPHDLFSQAREAENIGHTTSHNNEREYFTNDMAFEPTTTGKRYAAGVEVVNQTIISPDHVHNTTSQPDHDRRTVSNAMANLPPHERHIIQSMYNSDNTGRSNKTCRMPPKHIHELHNRALSLLRIALNVPPAG